MTVSIERIRELLGQDANGATDEQIAQLRDSLTAAAGQFFDDVQTDWRRDPESVRWFIHAAETRESE
jgi:hypothetical protein